MLRQWRHRWRSSTENSPRTGLAGLRPRARRFGSDTVTASGVADGFVTAGTLIAAWPAPVREAALACLPNVIALPSHQSPVIGLSAPQRTTGFSFCRSLLESMGETAAGNSFCGLMLPELSHFGKSPIQSTSVRVLPAPPRSPEQTGISRFSANRPEPAAICARILSLQSADWIAGTVSRSLSLP